MNIKMLKRALLLLEFLLETCPANVHLGERCPCYFQFMPSLRLTFEARPYFRVDVKIKKKSA